MMKSIESALRSTGRSIRELSADDLLRRLGLERRRSAAERVLPAFGVFGVGLLVGAGIGLLFAPKPGREVRGAIGDRTSHLLERARKRTASTIEVEAQGDGKSA